MAYSVTYYRACDRCGLTVRTEGNTSLRGDARGRGSRIDASGWGSLIFGPCPTDLCPECAKSFGEWLGAVKPKTGGDNG